MNRFERTILAATAIVLFIVILAFAADAGPKNSLQNRVTQLEQVNVQLLVTIDSIEEDLHDVEDTVRDLHD